MRYEVERKNRLRNLIEWGKYVFGWIFIYILKKKRRKKNCNNIKLKHVLIRFNAFHSCSAHSDLWALHPSNSSKKKQKKLDDADCKWSDSNEFFMISFLWIYSGCRQQPTTAVDTFNNFIMCRTTKLILLCIIDRFGSIALKLIACDQYTYMLGY